MTGIILMSSVGSVVAHILPYPHTWSYAEIQLAASGINLLFLIPFFMLIHLMDVIDEAERNHYSWFDMFNESHPELGHTFLAYTKPKDAMSATKLVQGHEYIKWRPSGVYEDFEPLTVEFHITKYDVPEKYRNEKYPRFGKLEKFALLHALAPETRFDFSDGKTIWNDEQRDSTKVCYISVDESMMRYRDEKEGIEYTTFLVVSSQGDRRFRDNPKLLYQFSLEKKPPEEWTTEEKKALEVSTKASKELAKV